MIIPALRRLPRNMQQLLHLSSRAQVSFNSSNIIRQDHNKDLSRNMSTVSAGSTLRKLALESPHVDVVRYQHKNVKWTLKHVDHFAESLGTGLVDNGLLPGDTILSWLPLHFAEQHILQFACSKAGFVLYHLDPLLAVKDRDGAKKALAKALELSRANVLISQDAGNDINYVSLVQEIVPETRIFNVGDGLPFFTPRYPDLRFPVHTGFDYADNPGMIPINQLLCPTGELSNVLVDHKIDGDTPLMGNFILGSDEIPTKKGQISTNQEVIDSKVWPEFTSILEKKYREVEGVGVVF